MTKILSGTAVAQALNMVLTEKIAYLNDNNIHPTLTTVRVGDNSGCVAYERGATSRGEKIGLHVNNVVLDESATEAEIIECIQTLNEDDSVHGVLILHPLPEGIDSDAVNNALAPQKDVDALTDASLVTAYSGQGDGYYPCTARAVVKILEFYGVGIEGKRVAILGRSLVIGRPVAMMLLEKNATPTICHSKTQNTQEITQAADIVIVATGRMKSIGKEYFRPGQVVIDVGTTWDSESNKLCGDVKYDEVAPIVEAITPVPGGVGAVTTSVLTNHVVSSAMKKLDI